MIITFMLHNLSENKSFGDDCIIDNCTDLFITTLDTDKLIERVFSDYEKYYALPEFVCRKWVKDISKGDVAVLLEFQSKGLSYFVITQGRVYIANDSNKTIRILN